MIPRPAGPTPRQRGGRKQRFQLDKSHEKSREQSHEQPFDPSAEYQTLLGLIEGKGRVGDQRNSGDVYQALMSKERRVLDTVDRVVNDSHHRDVDTRSLWEIPLHELVMRVAVAFRSVIEDLMTATSVEDALAAVAAPERRTYIGVGLVALALLVLVLSSGNAL